MPIFIYIVGTIYIYTMDMIGNVEDYLCNIENRMKTYAENNKIIGTVGWNIYMSMSTKSNVLNFFVYGYLFLIFAFYPIVSVVFGNLKIIYRGDPNNLMQYSEWRACEEKSVNYEPSMV